MTPWKIFTGSSARVEADFSNPLYAMGKITTDKDWEKYRYLFMMHVNLKLVEQHLRLGVKWDKQVAYFYNAPWKKTESREPENRGNLL